MSIFRETFKPEIKGSLEARQKAMTDRSVDTIQYLNSRNSWIRMVSSVNINGDKDTAQKNILQGGTLNPGALGGNTYSLKSGVGNKNYDAYSNQTPSGVGLRLGTRPMPGITSIEVKSKSAYGSLREVVVNFQCWDIRQLEELELLYMRPGYTTLVEWGWMPYLNNNGKIVTTPPTPYDIINKSSVELSVIAKELYEKSLKSGGNYDALFGYVKNYQWSARPDGGYDCQTTIISTGEIIESIKVNYVRPDLVDYKMYDAASKGNGYLNPEFDPQGNVPSVNFAQAYEKNTLAGIWSELYYKLADPVTKFSKNGIFDSLANNRGVERNKLWFMIKDLNFNNTTSGAEGGIAKNMGNANIYITLDVALEFINRYITAKSSGGEPLVKFSLITSNISSDSTPLLCLAHPIQVSVDPSVCLIKSPLWYQPSNDQNIVTATGATEVVQDVAAVSKDVYDKLKDAAEGGGTKNEQFKSAIYSITSITIFEAVEKLMESNPIGGDIKTIADLIMDEYGTSNEDWAYVNKFAEHLSTPAPNGPGLKAVAVTQKQGVGNSTTQIDVYTGTFTIDKSTITATTNNVVNIANNISNALDAINLLKDIKLDYFYGNANGDDELGVIRNIYVNLDFLYRTAIDQNIESQDHKEKNEISLYKYVKSMMAAINSSLGSMNNFEVHVDPIDNNVARVIDINFTEATKPSNLFELQVQNLNSVVRNYSLQSQIFPEQSSIIAIGSQAKGGQLGIQNNTMIDFNTNLVDRIIPYKEFPQQNNLHTSSKNNIGASLANIIVLFANFKPKVTTSTTTSPPSNNLDSLYSQAKNSLRDIIVYFQSTLKSPSANRSIIPIKFSFEMDGIGGLVIGHLFKVNKDILPSGYYKANLAQTVTGISHTINNGDWTTKIDALNIILDDPATKLKFSANVNIKDVVNNALTTLQNASSFDIIGGIKTGIDALKDMLGLGAKTGGNRTLDKINQIILHDTAGYQGTDGTVTNLKQKSLSVHYIIARDGTVVNMVPIEKIAYHALNTNQFTVGIEICNIGYLKEKNGKLIDEYGGTWDKDGAAFKKHLTPNDTSAGFVDLKWNLNGFRWYEGYTAAQMNALKTVIKDILSKCPNIKLNYESNQLSIYQNVFGLKSLTGVPVEGKSYNVDRSGYSTQLSGIFAHSLSNTDRVDAHINAEMTKILKEIKTETGR